MILSYANTKGGVGKTTLAINTAEWLNRQGEKVLLVDADIQGSSTTWASLRDEALFPVVQMARDNLRNEVLQLSQDYDSIVVDAPPRAEALNRAIVSVSDIVVIPVEPSGASELASHVIVSQIKEYQGQGGAVQACFVINRRVANTVLGNQMAERLTGYGLPILDATICNRIAFAESFTMSQTLYEWDSQHTAVKELDTMMHELRGYCGNQKRL